MNLLLRLFECELVLRGLLCTSYTRNVEVLTLKHKRACILLARQNYNYGTAPLKVSLKNNVLVLQALFLIWLLLRLFQQFWCYFDYTLGTLPRSGELSVKWNHNSLRIQSSALKDWNPLWLELVLAEARRGAVPGGGRWRAAFTNAVNSPGPRRIPELCPGVSAAPPSLSLPSSSNATRVVPFLSLLTDSIHNLFRLTNTSLS